MHDDKRLASEIRASLQTDKYLRTKGDGSLPSSTKRIHGDLAEENRDRRERLVSILHDLILGADVHAAGQKLKPKSTSPSALLDELMGYLVQNTFSKMGCIRKVNENPLPEIQAILRSNDVQQQSLEIKTEDANPQALDDLRKYIELCSKTSRQIVLHEMANERYANRPYGWPPMELCLLLARLLVLGEAQLVMDGAPLTLDKAYEPLTTPGKWRKVVVRLRKTNDPATIQRARNLGKEVFSQMGPEGEEQLAAFLRDHFSEWRTRLTGFKTLADTGHYPGKEEIDTSLSVIAGFLRCDDPGKFMERFLEQKEDLLEMADAFHDLDPFYTHQKPAWEKLMKAHEKFQLNRMELDRHDIAAPALGRMQEILKARSPYGIVKEAEPLIRKVEAVNSGIVDEARRAALEKLDRHISAMITEVNAASAEAAVKAACMKPLEDLKARIESQESVAHINQAAQEAERAFDLAVRLIEEAQAKRFEPENVGDKKDLLHESPKIKKRRVIQPSMIGTKSYLETQQDVEAFLQDLRERLEEAIKNNERVQIR